MAGLEKILLRLFKGDVQLVFRVERHGLNGLKSEVRVDGISAIADEHREMVQLQVLAGGGLKK